ncbi:MAG: AraC family transcriptional regulator [Oscillospiraceae bacterium]|jgi:AraC-like DNA-binding protein
MIKHLSGNYETVEYVNNSSIILYDNQEDENYPVHWHNAVEIIMPLQNNFSVSTGNSTYILEERDMIIIPPGELHSLEAPENGRRLIFQCDNSVLSDVKALNGIMPLFSGALYISTRAEKEISAFIKKTMLDIYDEYFSESEIKEVRIYHLLLGLFIKLRENQIKQHENSLCLLAGKYSEHAEKIKMVLKYIDNNYMYDINLDELAEIAGYSKYHFSRLFKLYCSVSCVSYVNTKRVKSAEMLLLDPYLPITEIAMRSGFSSLTSFNRIFKEIKHCTPTEFKKLYCNSHIDSGFSANNI